MSSLSLIIVSEKLTYDVAPKAYTYLFILAKTSMSDLSHRKIAVVVLESLPSLIVSAVVM